MKLPVEILHHIFSFLVSHPDTLNTCSKAHPALATIVEEHQYYKITVHIGQTSDKYSFKPHRLLDLFSANLRVRNHVHVLEINFFVYSSKEVEDLAKLLPMFVTLEYIKLNSMSSLTWIGFLESFQAAFEHTLNLPTLKDIHLMDINDFPLALLDNCKNVMNLSLSGLKFILKNRVRDPILPQLNSLTFGVQYDSPYLVDWVKPHINELQSLKYVSTDRWTLSEMLAVCSGTLKKLDVDLANPPYYYQLYNFPTGVTLLHQNRFPRLSPVPPNLQQLTVRSRVYLIYKRSQTLTCYESWLPEIADAINSFISLQHLVLDINISLPSWSNLTEVDLSPLAILGAVSIPCIDLYVHTGMSPNVTQAQLLPSLEHHEDIMRLIKQGVLVIHWEETAPGRV